MSSTFNLNNIMNEVLDDVERAVDLALPEIAKDIDMYVPYDTGTLSSSQVIDTENDTIYWTADHTEYVYAMPKDNNFNKSVHHLATSGWVEEAEEVNKKRWVNLILDSYRGL